MNSRAVRFACDRDLPRGLEVRLVIEWPAHLPSGAGLSLSLFGAIERSALREVEVVISRHEFRTRRGGEPEELSTVSLLARSAGQQKHGGHPASADMRAGRLPNIAITNRSI